jgi:hypothetical protein
MDCYGESCESFQFSGASDAELWIFFFTISPSFKFYNHFHYQNNGATLILAWNHCLNIRLVSQDWSFRVKLDLALPSCDVSTSALSYDLVGSIFFICYSIGPCEDELRIPNRFVVNKPWKFNRPYYWNT